MTTYKIIHNTTGKVVNLHIVDQTSAVPNGTRVSLYNWQNNNDQKWVAEEVAGSILLRLARDTNKVLNRHSTNNRAHVWNYNGTTETQNDSLVIFETAANGSKRIKLVHHNMYLTKNASDNYLSWTTETENDRQYFTPEVIEEGSSSTSTVIDLPTDDRTYNWNQFYTEVTQALNGRTDGCAWTCGLDVANIYGPDSYEPDSMASAWTSGGYGWGLPSNCDARFAGDYTFYNTTAEFLAKIRYEINNNRPVVVKLCTNENSKDNHFVVAYGYTDNGDTLLQIKVFDPAQSRTNTSTVYGRDTDLADAISWSEKDKILALMTVTTNR